MFRKTCACGSRGVNRYGLLCRVGVPLAILWCTLAFLGMRTPAQTTPKVASVDPATGKVNASVTLMGQNLGKELVSAVFLSDDKSDFKASILEQSADKITIKIPQVKPGDYHVSIQVGNNIFIKPLRIKVEE